MGSFFLSAKFKIALREKLKINKNEYLQIKFYKLLLYSNYNSIKF